MRYIAILNEQIHTGFLKIISFQFYQLNDRIHRPHVGTDNVVLHEFQMAEPVQYCLLLIETMVLSKRGICEISYRMCIHIQMIVL